MTTPNVPAVVEPPSGLPSVVTPLDAKTMEMVLLEGDLRKLTPAQRNSYYQNLCQSVGLNPLTRPFAYIELSGKLTLYALKGATDQLRMIHGVSVEVTDRRHDEKSGTYIVTAKATTPDGRTDEDVGAVAFSTEQMDRAAKKVVVVPLTGIEAANAVMKAETKAKRRVTLAICGLSFLDESELDTVKGAKKVSDAEVDGLVKSVEAPVEAENVIGKTEYRLLAETADRMGLSLNQIASRVGVAGPADLQYLSFSDYRKVMSDLEKVATAKKALAAK